MRQLVHTKMQLMQQDTTPGGLMELHAAQIRDDLKRLGADGFDMLLPETHRLPQVISPGELIRGVVYGRYQRKGGYGQSNRTPLHGRGALLVTDRRVLFLDKKPLFFRCDEIPLDLISGVTYARVGFMGTVTLRTKTGDYAIRTFNERCALNFVEAIELDRFAFAQEE